MQTASVPGFVRTILIIVGVYYAFKILARILMPILLRKMVQKAEQNFKQHTNYQNQADNHSTTQNSSSTFEKPKAKKQVGEYIDYEEVD
ncbi:DUF4834 family protein [Flavobacterium piscinae]|uniref:DUF4834 family protein n=1 Tax=Flavobacterium piscinae TaxID=2506424 RepID=A0A4Q1KTW4_9FLAO|nr:DUF4834 family protein [Flavobacterium piscinae]MBC8882459.1 DUF4834 family protein [Flavobacterium piscinae]RXR32534.1 DUF4834 family protein [Flavobacterium piscinae]